MSKYVYRNGTYGIVRYGISRQLVLVLVPVPYRYGIGSRLQLTMCSGSRSYLRMICNSAESVAPGSEECVGVIIPKFGWNPV